VRQTGNHLNLLSISADDPKRAFVGPNYRAAASPDLTVANPLCCHSG
jgi:hypothetical protein